MIRFFSLSVLTVSLPVLAGLAALALMPAQAQQIGADCQSPALPGVDWHRCYLDDKPLPGVDLTGARLRETRLIRANLSAAVLDEVDARRAKFMRALASGARFHDADLREADFTRANLEGADLTGADLRRTRFFKANLRRANLTGARLGNTDILDADLTGATWTNGTYVCGPGSIGQCK